MAQTVVLWGATYSNVPALVVPSSNGTVTFDDTTDATATAADIAEGMTAYVNGAKVTGTASGGGGNDFVVTLAYNNSTQMWEPDCTYAEAYAAVQAGKNVVAEAGDYNGASIVYDADEYGGFYYIVFEQFDDFNGTFYYNLGVVFQAYIWTADGIELDEDEIAYNTSFDTATPSDVAQGKYFHNASGIQVGTASGGASIKTATGTFTGNGTRTIDVSCSWEPDLVYFTSNPGTTASSGTVAAIIVRGMMTATRYRNNATTNSHYAIPDIADMNSSGSSYSWRATYANSKVTLYCFSNNARALLTNGRTYSYTFMKWT